MKVEDTNIQHLSVLCKYISFSPPCPITCTHTQRGVGERGREKYCVLPRTVKLHFRRKGWKMTQAIKKRSCFSRGPDLNSVSSPQAVDCLLPVTLAEENTMPSFSLHGTCTHKHSNHPLPTSAPLLLSYYRPLLSEIVSKFSEHF